MFLSSDHYCRPIQLILPVGRVQLLHLQTKRIFEQFENSEITCWVEIYMAMFSKNYAFNAPLIQLCDSAYTVRPKPSTNCHAVNLLR